MRFRVCSTNASERRLLLSPSVRADYVRDFSVHDVVSLFEPTMRMLLLISICLINCPDPLCAIVDGMGHSPVVLWTARNSLI